MSRTRAIRRYRRAAGGFTLVEVAMTAMLLGILSIAMAPTMRSFLTARDNIYKERQYFVNSKIAKGLLDYAEQGTTTGRLPAAPYVNSGSRFFSAPGNPTAGLQSPWVQFLIGQNVPLNELNDDATANQRVRVYQVAAGLTQISQLYGQSGPQATLTYDIGVVYTTNCGRAAACNTALPNSATGSVTLTTGNATTWSPQVTGANIDLGVVMFSSLPIQKKLQQLTAQRLDKIRDAMTAVFRSKVLTAAASDTTNWFPTPSNAAAWTVYNNSGAGLAAPVAGCRDGWYPLDSTSPTIDVLQQAGLSPSEFGTTAWGGRIEYCRKYDPALTGTYAAAPHFAAIRINKALTSALPPDIATATNNIIMSF